MKTGATAITNAWNFWATPCWRSIFRRACTNVFPPSGKAELARGLNLGHYLHLGRGEEAQGGRERPALLADAMEAVLGAVYLDGGHDEAARLVTRLYEGQWPDPASARKGKDYKTRLQEVTQARFRALPVYVPLASSGPEHAKVFEVRLELPDGRSFPASGGSLKRAEQEAARKALEYYGAQAGH